MKACKICKTEKPLSEYHRHKYTRDGLQIYCKACYKAKGKERYSKNKEKINAANKKWREENQEKDRELHRRWRQENRERASKVAAEWRKENIDKSRESNRLWKKRNPEKSKYLSKIYRDRNQEKRKEWIARWRAENKEHVRQYDRRRRNENRAEHAAKVGRRRAMQIQATPLWADARKIAEFYFAADFLSMATGEWHHVDHIVPILSKTVCGLHVEANLRVITALENTRKGNRWWPDMP